jgi:hypothetical protein
MGYRIRKSYRIFDDELRCHFFIQEAKKSNWFDRLFRGFGKEKWVTITHWTGGGGEAWEETLTFTKQKDAEEYMEKLCRRDSLVIPETHTVNQMNCND